MPPREAHGEGCKGPTPQGRGPVLGYMRAPGEVGPDLQNLRL